MLELFARLQPGLQQTPAAIIDFRHGPKIEPNGDLTQEGILLAQQTGKELGTIVGNKQVHITILSGSIDRVHHTADNLAKGLASENIRSRRLNARLELSTSSIFLDPRQSQLLAIFRHQSIQAAEQSEEIQNAGMQKALLTWMQRGIQGFGSGDGTVTFIQAQQIQAYWLRESMREVRTSYLTGNPLMVIRVYHELQAFLIKTFAYKEKRRGERITGEDIVRSEYGKTNTLSGPQLYLFVDEKGNTIFRMKLEKKDKKGRKRPEWFEVDEELINRLADAVYSIPPVITESKYDGSKSLLIRTMRRQLRMGYPMQESQTPYFLPAAA